MKIYIDRIPEEGLILEGEEPSNIIDIQASEEQFNENIHVSIMVHKVSGKLIVLGTVSTHVSLICSLCCGSFSYLVENKRFTYDCDLEGRDIIDLTEPIREDIIVGLPLRPLCRQDCRGLCAQCAKNLNIEKCSCLDKKSNESPLGTLGDFFNKI